MNKDVERHRNYLRYLKTGLPGAKLLPSPQAQHSNPHIAFKDGDPFTEAQAYKFLGDGTLIISCPACGRTATVLPNTDMYRAITKAVGMRCSKCFFQCRTHLRGLEADP